MRPIHLAKMDKTRPVLVLTRGIAVGMIGSVTVAGITSTVRGIGTELPVGGDLNGIDHGSVVNLDDIQTIRYRDLGRRLGYLADDQEPDLHAALVQAFDLEPD